jgi:hypothetical protein
LMFFFRFIHENYTYFFVYNFSVRFLILYLKENMKFKDMTFAVDLSHLSKVTIANFKRSNFNERQGEIDVFLFCLYEQQVEVCF